MQRARRYRIVGLALGVGLAGFIALTACANYGEGDRCERANGNDDCADGLTCTAAGELVEGYRGADRCCPAVRSTATHPACVQPQDALEAGTPPPDTGPPPDATNDTSTPVEAGTDADADAAEPADAADDG